MATIDKDFKVKNGLIVALGGSFGGAVQVGTPTETYHAATKDYVDTRISNIIIPTEDQAPSNPVDGQIYFDNTTQHLLIYSTAIGDWQMIASLYDAENMKQHIHDTAIDGTGLIVSVFQDCGFYDSIFTSADIAEFYNTEYWNKSYDGGNPLDNFN